MKKVLIGIGIILFVLFVYTALSKKSPSQTTDKPSSQTANTQPTQTQENSTRPAPPAGFSWKECHDSESAFLIPDGWYFKQEETQDTEACFITKEEIKNGGIFHTGLTVNIVRNLPEKLKVQPSAYANALIDALKKKYSVGKVNTTGEGTPFYITSVPTYIQSPNGEKINTLQMFIANDSTGTIYIVSYESPEASWEEDWKIGEKILQSLALNANY